MSHLAGVVLADAGYWHHEQIDQMRLEHGLQLLIPPDAGTASSRPGWNGGRYASMRRSCRPSWQDALQKRKVLIEPVFGHTFNRRLERFQRRGLAACRLEWRLSAATHNLTKRYRHQLAAARLTRSPARTRSQTSGTPPLTVDRPSAVTQQPRRGASP